MNYYESDRLLNEYLLFHYGRADEILPWGRGPLEALDFPVRSVMALLDLSRTPCEATCLDLGCAVGRSSFELASFGVSVLGIDYSQNFIHAAQALAQGEKLPYSRLEEADQTTPLNAEVPAHLRRDRVQFEVGDAMHLRPDLGQHDVVHAANLLCRLTQPQLLLQRLPQLVKPGGQLLLTTPCTWLQEFTPKENWPQGKTFDWLQEKLGGHFDLTHQQDLPFLIREHARKYQWSVALGTRWVRRS